MTKEQRNEFEKYFKGINEYQDTFIYSFKDENTILVTIELNQDVELSYEYDVDETISYFSIQDNKIYNREHSLKKNSVAIYIQGIYWDIVDNFNVNEELLNYVKGDSFRKDVSLDLLTQDLEKVKQDLDFSRADVPDYFLMLLYEEWEEENKKRKKAGLSTEDFFTF